MNKLPEPAMSCYDTVQLMTMMHEAKEELQARGWIVSWRIARPTSSRSEAKRIAIQTGTTEQADEDLAIFNAVGIIEGSGVVTDEDLP